MGTEGNSWYEQLTPEQRFAFHSSPTEWEEYASELFQASEVIWQNGTAGLVVHGGVIPHRTRKSLSRTYLFLVALSIENYLKGLAVAQDPNLVSSGHLSKSLRTHDLVRLAETHCQELTKPDQLALLKLLNPSIPYWGRYPIPLSESSIELDHDATEEVHKSIEALVTNLRLKLRRSVTRGWNGPHEMTLRSSIIYEASGDDERK